MKICIDAGHGGKDPGAITRVGGVLFKEKTLNLSYALALGTDLLVRGHKVTFTRIEDVYLFPNARLRFAKANNAEVFVSIHCNASDNPAAHGMEVIYRDEENDMILAECVYDSLLEEVPAIKGRGMKDDENVLNRRLAVLGDFPLPTCLVEVGFLTNEGDLHEMLSIEKIASAIGAGVARYCTQAGTVGGENP